MNSRLKKSSGIYLITPDYEDTQALCAQLNCLLQYPIALLQYRNKTANTALKHQQAQALVALCRTTGVPLIINDDWQLALDCGADGVHLGADDADPAFVRQQVGDDMIIGISCYNNFQRAEYLSHADIDYLAFGAIYPSNTKPNAASAELSLLKKAKSLHKPIVAIGGINPDNSAAVLESGADFIAVISSVFAADNPELALKSYLNIFQRQHDEPR
jgi:thiamine-phosphate pyrophosphorylase